MVRSHHGTVHLHLFAFCPCRPFPSRSTLHVACELWLPAVAPARNSFQVMPSCRALNDASMMFGDTPTVLQRSPSPLALSIITRVTAPVPALGVRMRTL